MNKQHWNTITLGGDVPDDELMRMVVRSYNLIKPKERERGKMNFVIEQFFTLPIVFMRRTGTYGAENNTLMEALKKWASKQGLFVDSIIYGIAQDNPQTTPPEQCRYDVCLVAGADCHTDESVQRGEIPNGKYAVFTIPHTVEAVQEFWNTVFLVLHNNNLQYDEAKPILERYKYRFVQDHKCEFCVPIL
jgi:DNA gyrase inhibitor GyrI